LDIVKYTTSFLLLPCLMFVLFYLAQTKLSFRWNEKAAAWLMSRGLFYREELKQGDELLINIIRIVLGCFLLYRLFVIAEFSLPLDPNGKVVLALCLYFFLLVGFTLGIFTPVSTLLLLAYQLHFNFALKTYTLGVDVTAMILMCMVLYPVGRVLSVDVLLCRRFNWLESMYRWFFYKGRITQLVTAKAVAFFSYCLLCLYSVLLHLDEPLWMNGNAAIHLLGSSYLSNYHVVFQQLFTSYPVAIWLAKFSMIGMVLWYFLLGPAVLIGGVFRKLALFWAIAFFSLSTFVLQLSILGYIEFLLFLMLFWTHLVPINIPSVNMLYDDKCNLCDRTVRFLKFVDIVGVIRFRPISENLDKAALVGVSHAELRNDLYSWEEDSKQVYSGYDFYLHLSRRLLVLHVLYPILLVFKWIKIGPIVYRVIAQRRIEIFGVCKLPVDTESKHIVRVDRCNQGVLKSFYPPFLVVSLMFSLFFIAILPVSPVASDFQKKFPKLVRSAHIFSWSRINVFNETDLKMTSHYYTASIKVGAEEILLPFTGSDGSRLDWHRSDRAYFGNSLRWRRAKNSKVILPPTKNDYKSYCEVLKWAIGKGYAFENGIDLTFYQAKWPSIGRTRVEYFPAKIVGEASVSLKKCKVS